MLSLFYSTSLVCHTQCIIFDISTCSMLNLILPMFRGLIEKREYVWLDLSQASYSFTEVWWKAKMSSLFFLMQKQKRAVSIKIPPSENWNSYTLMTTGETGLIWRNVFCISSLLLHFYRWAFTRRINMSCQNFLNVPWLKFCKSLEQYWRDEQHSSKSYSLNRCFSVLMMVLETCVRSQTPPTDVPLAWDLVTVKAMADDIRYRY